MARSKVSVAPTPEPFDPFEMHSVTLALDKARAMASVLWELDGDDHAFSKDTEEYLRSVVHDALRKAIDDAGAAFRKSLTPEQVREQLFGGPKAVA